MQSLRALSRFATYNADWITASASSSSSSAPLLIRPWGEDERPPQDPHEMMNREDNIRQNLYKLT